MTKFALAAAMALFVAAPVLAQDPPAPVAKLTEIEGRVLVNTGDEFRPAVSGQSLKPGDRIMAQNNGEATIDFDDGCEEETEVKENTIVTVPDRSTCAGGVPLVQQLNPAGAGAVGAAGADVSASHFILGSVAAIGIYLYFLEDDTETVSP